MTMLSWDVFGTWVGLMPEDLDVKDYAKIERSRQEQDKRDRDKLRAERNFRTNEQIPVGFVTAVKKVDAQSYVCEHSVERLYNVHSPHACAHQAACPVHRKTVHPVRHWEQTWKDLPGRTERRFMRRVCTHGRWVVDPDEPFKPSYEEQVRLGMQNCAACNHEFKRTLVEDILQVRDNILAVNTFLERGDCARVITLVERIPNGKEHELEFYPDEALLYLWTCVAELEEELGLRPGYTLATSGAIG